MKKDKYKTIVVFLKDTSEDFNGQICAYFPNEMYSTDKNLRTGYAHIGQHTAVHIDYAKECKIAKPNEYKELFNELQSIGYNLHVVTKIAPINKLCWNGLHNTIEYKRQPTNEEIKRGYGATHYINVPKKDFLKSDGTIKSRVKIDGLIYSR